MRQKMQILLFIILAIFFITFNNRIVYASETNQKGICGKNITWQLFQEEEGEIYTLKIQGTGKMYDYTEFDEGLGDNYAPWITYVLGDAHVNVEISEGITYIGKYAFTGETGDFMIENITLPKTLKRIGSYAFIYQGSSFSKIELPDNLEKIGDYAFSHSLLKEVKIPKKIKKLDGTFKDCVWLKKVELPDGIKKINQAFSGCIRLKEVNLPNTIIEMDEAFKNCKKLNNISIPKGIEIIGESAFENCQNLQKIKISKGVTFIDEKAFCNCINLEEIVIPNTVTDIKKEAFKNCKKLKSLTLSENLETIGKKAFYGCKRLRNVDIYEKVNNIGSNVFKNCNRIKLNIYGNEVAEKIAKKYKYPYTEKLRNINSNSISVNRISNKTYKGKALKPKPVLKIGKKKLILGTDYTVKYEDNIDIGKAKIIIKGKGNYTGTRIITFKIKKHVEDLDITLKKYTYKYDGNKKKPKVIVKDGNVLLEEDEDYEVSYSKNKKPGKAYVHIKGLNDYKGTVVETFKIKKK